MACLKRWSLGYLFNAENLKIGLSKIANKKLHAGEGKGHNSKNFKSPVLVIKKDL